jgi:prophage tail gpP-like protein
VTAIEPTRRITLSIDGQDFFQFYRADLCHDLSELAASFELACRDELRAMQAWEYATGVDGTGLIDWGKPVTIAIDGVPWLIGYIDDVMPDASVGQSGTVISGRDLTGDLVDCPPDPRGKHEYRDISLTELAEKLCAPFGIKVRCDTDVSPNFDKCTVEAGETVLSILSKYAKQRGVLITTDRVGTLIITRSGQERAAADIRFPGNVTRLRGSFSARERFSDYFVKGQSEKNGGRRSKTAPLDVSAEPLESAPAQTPPATDDPQDVPEGAGTLVMGHARDPEVTRWRPFIAMARTKATAFDAQRQAEWEMRTRRGKGDKEDYAWPDFVANGQFWKPNTIAGVADAYSNIDRDMLVAGVRVSYGERGARSSLRMTGPEAYDLLPENDRRADKGSGKSKGKVSSGKSGKLDGTAKAL